MSYKDDHGEGYIPAEDNTLHYFITSPAGLGTCAVNQYQRHNTESVQTNPTARGDDFMAVLNLRATPQHRGWINGREISVGASREGQFRLCDLRDSHISEVPYAFNSVHLFMPNSAFGEKAGSAINWKLDVANPSDDAVLSHLLQSLLHVLNDPDSNDQLFCDLVLLGASRHIAKKYASLETMHQIAPGTLSRQQEERAKELMISRISGSLSLAEIAQSCGLSSDQFGRLFKKTTGLAPYRWLTGQRIDRAKNLLRNSNHALVDIALACGFANQSHFTRTFTGLVGASPGDWRRRVII